MRDTLESVFVGSCPVDSGQIMLIDPCYILQGKFPEDEDSDYAKACNVTLNESRGAGEVAVGGAQYGHNAVVTSTLDGDGSYPVYAKYKPGRNRPVSIEIFFDYEEMPDDDDPDF